jgi:hypothetical protein
VAELDDQGCHDLARMVMKVLGDPPALLLLGGEEALHQFSCRGLPIANDLEQAGPLDRDRDFMAQGFQHVEISFV